MAISYLTRGLRYCHIIVIAKEIHFLFDLDQHLLELALYIRLEKEVHIPSGIQEFLRVFDKQFSGSLIQISQLGVIFVPLTPLVRIKGCNGSCTRSCDIDYRSASFFITIFIIINIIVIVSFI